VFTYNRLEGLKRLWKSLATSRYGTDVVALKVFFDYKDAAHRDTTEQWLNENAKKTWTYGPVTLHRRETNVGLKHNIIEAWYPLDDSPEEVVAFFEDDIEVSEYWYEWVRTALVKYAPQRNGTKSKQFLGISLYRPIHDELTGHKMKMHMEHPTTPFMFQQPCSWGAVYFGSAWKQFRNYYTRTRHENPVVESIDISSNTWDSKSSWKKYLIKHMIEEGSYMLYANFPDKAVLSTNHLMKGEHPLPPRHLFELPLLTTEVVTAYRQKQKEYDPLAIPAFEAVPVYNVVVERVASVDALTKG
jgi:hypothetical protein